MSQERFQLVMPPRMINNIEDTAKRLKVNKSELVKIALEVFLNDKDLLNTLENFQEKDKGSYFDLVKVAINKKENTDNI